MSGGLDRRLDKLEQGEQSQGMTTQREQLADYFAAAIYDAHREALIDALCSEDPRYEFEVTDGPARAQGRYVAGWHGREQGAPPYVLHYTDYWRSDAS